MPWRLATVANAAAGRVTSLGKAVGPCPSVTWVPLARRTDGSRDPASNRPDSLCPASWSNLVSRTWYKHQRSTFCQAAPMFWRR